MPIDIHFGAWEVASGVNGKAENADADGETSI